MRRVATKSSSPVKRVVSGAQRFSLHTRDDGRQLPVEDDKYTKSRVHRKRQSTKCRLCICLCLVGICGGAVIGIALLAVMGHDIAGNNEVVGKMQRRTKASIHHAYEKFSKQLDKSKRYREAVGNVKNFGQKISRGFGRLRKAIQESQDGPGANSAEDSDAIQESPSDQVIPGLDPTESKKSEDGGRRKIIASTFRERYDKDYNHVLKLLEKERKIRKRTEHEMMNLKQQNFKNKMSNQIIDGVPQRHAVLKPHASEPKEDSIGDKVINENFEDESLDDDEEDDEDENMEDDNENNQEDNVLSDKEEEHSKVKLKEDDEADDMELSSEQVNEEKEEDKLLGIQKSKKMDDKPDEEAVESNREEKMINSLVENAPVVKIGRNNTSNNSKSNGSDDLGQKTKSDQESGKDVSAMQAGDDDSEDEVSENIDTIVSNKVVAPVRPESSNSKEKSDFDNQDKDLENGNDANIVMPESGIERRRCRPDRAHLSPKDFHASQGQDHFVFKLNGKKSHGFFVEFGAGDGMVESATYVFEKRLCWTGLCIEPSKVVFEDLKKNRPECIRVHGAICGKGQEGNTMLYLDVLDENGQWTGLSGFENKMTKYHKSVIERKVKNKGWSKQTYPVQCYDLNSLISKFIHKHHAVDFLSIDVEGFEKNIVQSIDFQANAFGIVQIESNVPLLQQSNDHVALEDVKEVRKLFEKNGFLARASDSGVDDFFIHPSIVKTAMQRNDARHRRRHNRARIRRGNRAPYDHNIHGGFGHNGLQTNQDEHYMQPADQAYYANYAPPNMGWQHQGALQHDHPGPSQYDSYYGHDQGWQNNIVRKNRYYPNYNHRRRRRAPPIYNDARDGGYNY